MVWCTFCVKNVEGTSDAGRLWCSGCGKVLEDHIFSEEPTFVKNAAGQSQLAGIYVRSRESEISASRERILENENLARSIIASIGKINGVPGK